MPNIMTEDFDRVDSPFHKDVFGSIDGLVDQLGEMVTFLENRDGNSQDDRVTKDALWDQTTGRFNVVLGGLQKFLTALHIDYSRLEFEADKVEIQRKALESERDELIEKSHNLHCRIKYNALEVKLDQTFSEIEKCSSVKSAMCFRDEADENLRRTKEIIRLANLRNCQLDKDIFNEMEHMTDEFKKYDNERETYVKELDLFDDVRRRKISDWLNESRSEEEREVGENVIEFLDLSQRQRHLEPKLTVNALRMYSFNESLAYDRLDNIRRTEELASLQAKIDAMSGVNHVLPRSAAASMDLMTQRDVGFQGQRSLSNDANRPEGDDLHVSPGQGLHRCPRRTNLATDPITDPDLRHKLELVASWEPQDESVSMATNDLTEPSATIGSDDSQASATVTLKRPISNCSVEGCDGFVGSTTSLCGDAISYEKLHDATAAISTAEVAPSRSSHLLLHQIESVKGLQEPPWKQELVKGLIKRKPSGAGPGGNSSMTAIDSEEARVSAQRQTAEKGETRSLGWGAGGRAGSSGSCASNSGNPRNSRDHL